MDRVAFLHSFIVPGWRGLEIGPSYNPILPKSIYTNVETVDYLNADKLRVKYSNSPNVNIDWIETVDYVVVNGDIAATVAKCNFYDYILASHVIEHMPDFIQFLQDCQKLLKPSGILILAIPDKRYCFDIFQPLSSTGAILNAHTERNTKPSAGAVFDDLAYNLVRNETITWLPHEQTGSFRFYNDFETAKAGLAAARAEESRQDVHIWRFVPSSFRLIVNDLYEIGETVLREQSFREIGGFEFFITLSKEGQGPNIGRLELAKRAALEHGLIKFT